MSSTTSSVDNSSDRQILSHYVFRRIRENGGPVKLEVVSMSISSVADLTADEASTLIQEGAENGTYTLNRTDSGNIEITHADPIGTEPDVITDYFGELSADAAAFTKIDQVTPKFDDILNQYYDSFNDLAEASPNAVATTLNDELDTRAETVDFDSLTGLTPSESKALHSAGVTTKRDLVQADAETVAEEAGSTLTPAKVDQAQSRIADDVTIVTESDADAIIDGAFAHIDAGKRIARDAMDSYNARVNELGHAGARVTKIDEESETVGKPLADVRSDLDPDDPEAVYVSDIGHNDGSPVNTGFPVLEDVGYEKVPKPETHPEAGPAALPVDENGDVVPPTVPLERDLKIPVDEMVAKKLGENVPVRIIGPRGSGKNYLMKYLAYKTNRGYRSLDVDKGTMPQDLFGPIAPNEDGVIEPKNGAVKQGLLSGDLIVINEFPVMQAGAAIALHQLLNENRLIIKSHGEEIDPHPQARIVITMNPPTREYRDSEPMNAATRGRFRSFWMGYPDSVDDEVRTLDQQINSPRQVITQDTLERVVEFAHRTRQDELSNWPTLSTRNLTIVCEHIVHGASPRAALKNVIRTVAEPHQNPEDAFDALENVV